ncbi:adenosine receptor A3-like [Porites lutea]|uniref:adenosine receptor A3-like n=1 Tax=Porites lutea TaxID=51062 RepID=UPI003CC53A3E
MALENFTEDENHRTVEELFCSAEFVSSVESELIFFSALNIFFFVTAFLGNTLILVALHKETSLHPPSKLLYRNLAITDLCVGIIVEPLAVTYGTSVVKERWDICYYAVRAGTFPSFIFCSVSLLTVTAISVDRLLALLLGLEYREVVTFRRTFITVTSFWILSIVVVSTVFLNLRISSWYLCIIVALALSRGMSSSLHRAWQFTVTLVYSNSSLNPLLYCLKIREVRQAVKVTLRQLFC